MTVWFLLPVNGPCSIYLLSFLFEYFCHLSLNILNIPKMRGIPFCSVLSILGSSQHCLHLLWSLTQPHSVISTHVFHSSNHLPCILSSPAQSLIASSYCFLAWLFLAAGRTESSRSKKKNGALPVVLSGSEPHHIFFLFFFFNSSSLTH